VIRANHYGRGGGGGPKKPGLGDRKKRPKKADLQPPWCSYKKRSWENGKGTHEPKPWGEKQRGKTTG